MALAPEHKGAYNAVTLLMLSTRPHMAEHPTRAEDSHQTLCYRTYGRVTVGFEETRGIAGLQSSGTLRVRKGSRGESRQRDLGV